MSEPAYDELLRRLAAAQAEFMRAESLTFRTWQDLTEAQGLDDDQATDVMSRLVAAAG